jgi:hypothetical protein
LYATLIVEYRMQRWNYSLFHSIQPEEKLQISCE